MDVTNDDSKIFAMSDGGRSVEFALCGALPQSSCSGHSDVAACLDHPQGGKSILGYTTAREYEAMSDPDKGVTLTFTGQTHGSHTSAFYRLKLTLLCDEDASEGAIQSKSFPPPLGGSTYEATLKTAVACPVRQSLSGGTIFLLVFFAAAVLYVGFGALYNWRVRGASGMELLPNAAFWRQFATLVADGCRFTLATVTCRAPPQTQSTAYQASLMDQSPGAQKQQEGQP